MALAAHILADQPQLAALRTQLLSMKAGREVLARVDDVPFSLVVGDPANPLASASTDALHQLMVVSQSTFDEPASVSAPLIGHELVHVAQYGKFKTLRLAKLLGEPYRNSVAGLTAGVRAVFHGASFRAAGRDAIVRSGLANETEAYVAGMKLSQELGSYDAIPFHAQIHDELVARGIADLNSRAAHDVIEHAVVTSPAYQEEARGVVDAVKGTVARTVLVAGIAGGITGLELTGRARAQSPEGSGQ